MELKILTEEQKKTLQEPLPKEALKQHPTKKFLTTINPAYVIDRMNDVFGIGTWNIESDIVEQASMVVLNVHLNIPEYGIFLHSFGGNDNVDKGDAYKGAQTDGFTKCCSYLGIGLGVWKNENKPVETPTPKPAYNPPSTNEEYGEPLHEKKKPVVCAECGALTTYREGTTKNGKPYKANFCASGIQEHTQWIR